MQLRERGYLKSIIDREKLIRFKRAPAVDGRSIWVIRSFWRVVTGMAHPGLSMKMRRFSMRTGSRYVERKHFQASRDA